MALTKGQNLVEFIYRPRLVLAGGALTGVGFFVRFAAFLSEFRSRQQLKVSAVTSTREAGHTALLACGQSLSEALIGTALAAGGPDNITALLVECRGEKEGAGGGAF